MGCSVVAIADATSGIRVIGTRATQQFSDIVAGATDTKAKESRPGAVCSLAVEVDRKVYKIKAIHDGTLALDHLCLPRLEPY
jgi:hypothetical protein